MNAQPTTNRRPPSGVRDPALGGSSSPSTAPAASRRDTWPSGSCRGAGGFLVCHLTPGVLPTREDLIQTFHEAPRETLATVVEQIRFEQQCRTSL
ncbi:hypothetical protein OOK27_50850 [Streptomyces canus]|uniref:hypothetical protein n=1 Tax=Streptomyces canus TaxID=58343 RepID=UPI00224DCC19|nr:hypothetical protein [Streptomyces canus]MCX5262321.1 hypothetical protein [Streptomyces canus]